MKHNLSERVLDAGYETLFYLGGFLALSVQPTLRNLDGILEWIDESHSRRELLRSLERRGLVTSGTRKGKWVPLLTDLGRATFAGGRHPEFSWNRDWDGQWRLLMFDLPRKDNPARMRLRRWMCSNHFGRLQGSVWVSPDPVAAIEKALAKGKINPTHMEVFEGTPARKDDPRELAATAWDFGTINAGYRKYSQVTERALRNLQKSIPSQSRLQGILRDDRRRWWEAVRHDPLLPKPIHPKGYEGPGAWKLRGQLLKKLGKDFKPPNSI